MSVTQKQIADALGLSQMTVSYALRGSSLIADDTRQTVLRTARELGYRPNSSARAIKSGRFNHIAMIVSQKSYKSYLPSPLISGVHDELADRNAHMTLAAITDEKLTDDRHLPKAVREWSVDGLLINYIQDIPQPMERAIARNRIPSVWINTKRSQDCVFPNDLLAARQVTERLLELGHTRIAYIAVGPSTHYSFTDRREGHRVAMHEAGLVAEGIEVSNKARGDQDLTAVLERRLANPDRPTALICYSQEEAGAAMVAARLNRLSVPDDLSVACFTAEPTVALGKSIAHALIPFQQVGQEAVNMLMKVIDEPDQPHEALPLPHELHEAETMGKAPEAEQTNGNR